MPYITPEAKEVLDSGAMQPGSEGELTYAITQLAIAYCLNNGLCFATCADVLAALDATSREFYRRVVAPYEDSKIRQNGDVYPEELLSGR